MYVYIAQMFYMLLLKCAQPLGKFNKCVYAWMDGCIHRIDVLYAVCMYTLHMYM